MYHYKLLISEVLSQESEIEAKELSHIISGRGFHVEFWINWPPILQELMDITLEFDTRYHEGQKEKKPEASKSNSSQSQSSSNSNQKKKKNFQKRNKPHSSLLNKDVKLMNSEK
ncbi:hypothetical protein O181_035002 [Austropuccinia psidii MF-1]|uniref:Uncharacterized protein n=1 Tax=Austropuccinia psidii MF-1 TaxID=1389203 RepID=A0A9Q3D7S7_9BASI|nr:hypothetical protein [Austropuccinia psidii MF-1]